MHRTVAKGTDADQFALFLWFCRKHRLDPVAKEVYCLLFNVTKHHQDEKGIWHPGKDMVILTGIGGLRGLAGRNYPAEYGSTDEPEFTFSGQKTPAGKLIPDTCTVRVWKKGATRPTAATLYWEEFAPRDLTDDRFKFWNHSPKNQLAKCAEGQALKKAYPDLSDIYVTEELARRISEQTPEGRQIRYPQERLQMGSHEASQKVLEAKLAGQMPLNAQEGVPGAAWKREAEIKADMPPIDVNSSQTSPASRPASSRKLPESAYNKDNVPPSTPQEPWKYNGIIEIDYSKEAWPIIRGDLQGALDELKKACPTMDWGKDEFWHVQPRDLEALKQACVQLNYEIKELFPKPAPQPVKSAPKEKTTAEGPRLAKGIIEQANPESGKVPRVSVLLKMNKAKYWMSAFDTALFPFLIAGKGQQAELFVTRRVAGDKTFTNIVGLKRVGAKEFEDGKVPVIQNSNREAGTRTLF